MKTKLILLLMAAAHMAWSWGQVGHYTTGYIAEKHLSKKARKKVNMVLRGKTIAQMSVWMDEIRSDDRYDYTADWHWVTIPDGMTYEETEKNPRGDVIAMLEKCIGALKADTLSAQKEFEYLGFVIHMVGDIHQPLHVGTGEDRGGNDVRVQWFSENTNLHRVWDTQMIEGKAVGYLDLYHFLPKPDKDTIRKWQSATVRNWAYESMSYRKQVYDVPDDGRLGYDYNYQYFHIVEHRILQAGIRLAGILNEIYG